MNILYKRNLIFIIILSQVVLAVSAGVLALYFSERDLIPHGVQSGEVYIGELDREQAEKKLASVYDDVIKNSTFSIVFDSGEEFKIKYSEISTAIDYTSTVEEAYGCSFWERLVGLLKGRLASARSDIFPVVTFNEQMLRDKLAQAADVVDKPAVNADIALSDGNVVKVPGKPGVRLNVDNSVASIRENIAKCLSKNLTLSFQASRGYEVESVEPKVSDNDLEYADQIIASYTTEIKNPDIADPAAMAALAINKVLVFPADKQKGTAPGEFSFNNYLEAQYLKTDKYNEGFNQVASTLYAALLLANIGRDAIVKDSHTSVPDYIEPGLDVILTGNSHDFKFKNTLEHPIIIFANADKSKVSISIVGKGSGSKATNSLQVDVEQKYDPPILTVENNDLRPGESKLISGGKQGMDVSVYIVTQKDGAESGKKLLYSQKYSAVEAIIQIGPNTKWESRSGK